MSIQKGINRFQSVGLGVPYKFESLESDPCIFISHIKANVDAAIEIGEAIKNLGIDIYLDNEDKNLVQAVDNNDHQKITEYINKGIDNSTHLLFLVSSANNNSWWVPYEIGYAKKGRRGVAALKLKDFPENELPSFLKIGTVLLGADSLNSYLNKISTSNSLLESTLVERLMMKFNDLTKTISFDKYLEQK